MVISSQIMVQEDSWIHFSSRGEGHIIAVNTMLNRMYIYIHDEWQKYSGTSWFVAELKNAFRSVRPHCTLLIDGRNGEFYFRHNDEFRLLLITLALQHPVKAFAEIITTSQLEGRMEKLKSCLYNPVFRKFTSIHAAETWLNDVQSIKKSSYLPPKFIL